LIEVIFSTYTPAGLVVAAILGLDNMNHLLNLVGEPIEILANPFLGKDMARLDRMLMVDMMDMVMGMEMLVLVFSMVVLPLVLMNIVLVIVAFANLLGAVRNGYTDCSRNCAKRNERE
jgi:hypothetical protein